MLVLDISIELQGVESCLETVQLEQNSGCNQREDLCGKKYNEIIRATMHNAYATTQDKFIFAQHRGCMKLALKKGVRAFMLDLHMMSAHELGLCHHSCAFGSISLDKTFQMFRDFLHLNPREVITIIWEVVCIHPCENSIMYTMWVNKLK